MKIPVTAAKAQLTELVRRAEAGEEVVLTRHGRPAVRLVPEGLRAPSEVAERREAIRRIAALAAAEALPGPDAARSQDYLYDEHGAPR